jgi:hypothetical protein
VDRYVLANLDAMHNHLIRPARISRSFPYCSFDSGIYCSELCKFPLRCLLQKFELRLREIGEARGQEILSRSLHKTSLRSINLSIIKLGPILTKVNLKMHFPRFLCEGGRSSGGASLITALRLRVGELTSNPEPATRGEPAICVSHQGGRF